MWESATIIIATASGVGKDHFQFLSSFSSHIGKEANSIKIVSIDNQWKIFADTLAQPHDMESFYQDVELALRTYPTRDPLETAIALDLLCDQIQIPPVRSRLMFSIDGPPEKLKEFFRLPAPPRDVESGRFSQLPDWSVAKGVELFEKKASVTRDLVMGKRRLFGHCTNTHRLE